TRTFAISTTSTPRSRTATSWPSSPPSREDKMAEEAERDVPEGVAVFPLVPRELGVDPLLLAVIHSVVFLEGSEDEMVHPEAAEEVMHYIATYLQRLDGARLQKVKEDLLTLTGFAKQERWPKQAIRFLKEFLVEFGIGAGE